MDREHHLRRRAEQVIVLLHQLWGDLPPPAPDPQLTTFIDALAGDDASGQGEQLVVQGDGLTYHQLAQALLESGPRQRALAKLPPRLLQQLVATGAVSPLTTSGMAALPDERCGLWELVQAGTVTFDATCARLLGVGHHHGQAALASVAEGQRSVLTFGDTMHPDDQPLIAAALEEAFSTGRRYETRFRVRQLDGTYAWRASRARTVPATDSSATRLIGFIAADD